MTIDNLIDYLLSVRRMSDNLPITCFDGEVHLVKIVPQKDNQVIQLYQHADALSIEFQTKDDSCNPQKQTQF